MDPVVVAGPWDKDRPVYLLRCVVCDTACGDEMPIPFESPQARSQWASDHTAATEHNCWWVEDLTPVTFDTDADGLRPKRQFELTYAQRITPANRFRNMHFYAKNGVTVEWREAFKALALEQRIPRLASVGITVKVDLKFKRRLDVEASLPCAKAAIDGLVDAGVLPDDQPPFVQWIMLMAPVLGCDADALTLVVQELELPA